MTDNIVDDFKGMSQLPPEVAYKLWVPNPDPVLKSGHQTYLAFDANLNFLGTIEVYDASRMGRTASQPPRDPGDGIFKFVPSGNHETFITDTQHYTKMTIEAPEAIIELMRKAGISFPDGEKPTVISKIQVLNGETSTSGYEASFEAHVITKDGAEGTVTFTKVQQLVDMGPGPWMQVSGWVGEFEGKSGSNNVVIPIPEFALFASDQRGQSKFSF